MSRKEILQILKCPYCSDMMFPPIYICSAGHSICKKCKDRLGVCPTRLCDGMFNLHWRNYSLEHISEEISHPCPHDGNGCTELLKYKNLNNHAKSCCFRPYVCNVNAECDFKGSLDALNKHFEEEHPLHSWMRENSNDRWDRNSPESETQVVFCYDEMFYFHRELVNNIYMYWTCQYIGKSDDAANFTYTITFDDGTGRKYSYRDRCQSELLTMKDIIASGRCLGMFMQVFESYLDEEEKIWYSVIIEEMAKEKP